MTQQHEALENTKLLDLSAALARRERLRAEGKRVVLTNGCFDLLHTGHLYYLKQAAALGDALFIALNAAVSVRALKGETRPVQGDAERAYALASLVCVDTVFLFETPRLTAEINALKPDVYAKAGDYTLETLNAEEREALQAQGTSIQFIPFLSGYSTTDLIRKIQNAASTLVAG